MHGEEESLSAQRLFRIRIRMSFIGQVCLHTQGICYSDKAPQCNRMTATGQDTDNKRTIYKYSMTTARELQKIVESRGQKTLKKIIKQPLHHHMLFGRVSRNILLTHPKTISSIFSYQTRLELQMGLASMVR